MDYGAASRLDASRVGFVERLSDHGGRNALISGERTLTYSELAEQVESFAAKLAGERRLALLHVRNDLDSVVAYLGALAAGHPVTLVSADDDSAAAALTDRYRPDIVLGGSCVSATTIEQLAESSSHFLHPDLALLLSTSGSTGSPKLVRLSHANIESNAAAIAEYLLISERDRAATTLPLHYCYGLSVLHSHLLAGASLMLTGLSVVDGCFWNAFLRHGCTSFAGVPHTFELLDRVGFEQMELPSLRYVTQAGGRMDPETIRRFGRMGRRNGWDLYVMYGQTEATARMSYLPPEQTVACAGSIGVPIPGGSFAIEAVAAVEEPGVGELVYSGPNVMLGYAESPPDLALGRSLDALRTGDLARRRDDGMYEIVGRLGRFLKIFGLRVDLQRVESRLAESGWRVHCTGDDERLVVATEEPVDTGELRRSAAEASGLPLAAVSAFRIDSLPRLASGKPNYRELIDRADQFESAASDPHKVAQPCDSSVASLTALFALVLEISSVDPQESFVSLGGDSLSYVEMSVALEQALGDLPASWHTMTIADLSAQAEQTAPNRSWHRVETSVMIRALAIVLIVGTHAGLWSVTGGAHVLLAVAGFNFARFLLGPEERVVRLRAQATSVARIAVPSVIWIAAATLLMTRQYGVENVFLMNGILGPEEWSAQWNFWFVEALMYVMIAVGALLAVPAIDRLERRRAFGFAIAMLAVGVALRFDVVQLGAPHTKPVFWLFAIGWVAARASNPWQRALASAAAAVCVPGFFGDPAREAVMIAGIMLLVWVPMLPSPAALNRLLVPLAGASLYIYLSHWQVFPRFEWSPAIGVLASLLAGIAYWKLYTRGSALAVDAMSRFWSRLRPLRRLRPAFAS